MDEPREAGLSERPTLRWSPDAPVVEPPVIAEPTDSTPPLPPANRRLGPILAASGAIALGVTVAMVLAPRVAAWLRDPEAPAAAAPVIAEPAPREEGAVEARGAVTSDVSHEPSAPGQPEDAPLADEAASDEAPVDSASVAAVGPELEPVHFEASRQPRRRRARARRAPDVADPDLGAAPAPPAAGELEPSAVQAVLRHQQNRMRQCYTTAVRRTGSVRDAQMRVIVDVAPEGQVLGVRVDGRDFGGMGECLRRVALRWRFPRSASGARIPVPIRFTAQP